MEKIKHPECICCGYELEPVPVNEMMSCVDDDYVAFEYRCPNCGVYETAYLPGEDERDSYPAYNEELDDSLGGCSHGYDGFCPECGSHIIWSGDFMRSEVWGDVDGEVDQWGCFVDDSLAPNVMCPHCGASIEIVYPKPSEEKNYPYYKDKEGENDNS